MRHRSPRDARRPPRRGFLVALLVAGTLAGCATNPVTGQREFTLMSEAQELAIGAELDEQVRQEMGVYDDEALQAYVGTIGLRLAATSQRPDLPWQFTIVDVAAVNAFALPGGYIYLTRGIMAYLDDEAELAGVLGHEIGHVTARHAVQQYTRATGVGIGLTLGSIFFPQTRPVAGLAETGLGLLFLKYGRDDELQADRLGAEYAALEGWDPAGVADMLTTLGRMQELSDRRGIPNWISTHPQPEDRVERVQATVTRLRDTERTYTVDRAGYQRRIDGMVFGDNPEEGIVRGNAFLHPELRFALEFPAGWEITNGSAQVVGKRPGEDAFLVLQLLPQPRGSTIREVAVRAMRDAGLRELEPGTSLEINGLEGHIGIYRGRVGELGEVRVRAAHIRHGRPVYFVGGLAREALFEAVDDDFARTIRSFRPLDAEEAADVRPNRIALYVVRDGDTWQGIAQGPGQGNIRATTLAIMNHYPVSEQPQVGSRIRIVVAG